MLSGDVVCSGIREICKRRFEKRVALSIGAPLGNLEGGLTGNSESFVRHVQEDFVNGASLSL